MYILKQLFFSISVNSGFGNIYLDFKELLLNILFTLQARRLAGRGWGGKGWVWLVDHLHPFG